MQSTTKLEKRERGCWWRWMRGGLLSTSTRLTTNGSNLRQEKIDLSTICKPCKIKYLISTRSNGKEHGNFIIGNSFDLRKRCRVEHWDIATWQNFVKRKKHYMGINCEDVIKLYINAPCFWALFLSQLQVFFSILSHIVT